MTRIFLSLILMFSAGCLNVNIEDEPQINHLGIDDAFHEYVLSFEEAWGHQVTNTDIVFVDSIPGMVLADASTSPSGGLIRVDKSKWLVNHWDTAKKVIIWHELGHAVLLRDHVPQPDDSEAPVSIMQPIITVRLVSDFGKDPGPFIDELFERQADSAALTWRCFD